MELTKRMRREVVARFATRAAALEVQERFLKASIASHQAAIGELDEWLRSVRDDLRRKRKKEILFKQKSNKRTNVRFSLGNISKSSW